MNRYDIPPKSVLDYFRGLIPADRFRSVPMIAEEIYNHAETFEETLYFIDNLDELEPAIYRDGPDKACPAYVISIVQLLVAVELADRYGLKYHPSFTANFAAKAIAYLHFYNLENPDIDADRKIREPLTFLAFVGNSDPQFDPK